MTKTTPLYNKLFDMLSLSTEIIITPDGKEEKRNTREGAITKEALEDALAKGFDIDEQDENGLTLFEYAATVHDMKTVENFVNHGANIYKQNEFLGTPLDIFDDLETQNRLIALSDEYIKQHPEAIELARASDAYKKRHPANTSQPIKPERVKTTPIYDKFLNKLFNSTKFTNIKNGEVQEGVITKEELEDALANGFDIDEKNKDGLTICNYAAFYYDAKTVVNFINHGANIYIKDNLNGTLLDYFPVDIQDKLIALSDKYIEQHPEAKALAQASDAYKHSDEYIKRHPANTSWQAKPEKVADKNAPVNPKDMQIVNAQF